MLRNQTRDDPRLRRPAKVESHRRGILLLEVHELWVAHAPDDLRWDPASFCSQATKEFQWCTV